MSIDQDAEHAETFVVFDEAHSSHVGSEVVDGFGAIQSLLASAPVLQIELLIFHARHQLMPIVERFDIDGANILMALANQIRGQVSADETAAATYYYSVS